MLLTHRPTETVVETPSPPAAAAGPVVPRWWVLRAVTVGLWVLVCSGVLLGVVALARPAPSSAPSAVQGAVAPRWDVAGFAEIYVASFVAAGEGGEEALASFLGGPSPALSGVVAGEWFASRTTTSSLEALGGGRWAVTVAADLLRRDGDAAPASFAAVGVRFFRVEIVERDGALVAAGWPAIVAGPVAGGPVDDGWPAGSPPAPEDPLADSVQRFLAALLTGSGELGRYAAPGSRLRAAAATFETVTLERLAVRGDGDRRRVRAWLLGSSGGAGMRLVYDLHLARRDGRWEVAAVGTTPVTDPVVPAGTAVPSSTLQGS